ncbi:hypothetical protein D3C76_1650430 [compost metagenome]
MHQLNCQVEQQDADKQCRQRRLGVSQRHPRQQQCQQTDRGTQRAFAPIGQAPGPVGRQGTGGAGQAEQADHCIRIVVWLD